MLCRNGPAASPDTHSVQDESIRLFQGSWRRRRHAIVTALYSEASIGSARHPATSAPDLPPHPTPPPTPIPSEPRPPTHRPPKHRLPIDRLSNSIPSNNVMRPRCDWHDRLSKRASPDETAPARSRGGVGGCVGREG